MEQKIVTFKGLQWTNIIDPGKEQTEYLKNTYHFHELDLEDCLSETQRSKIDDYEKYLFIVLHFPIFHSKKKLIETVEVDIFVGQNYLITLHDGNIKALNDHFKSVQEKLASRKKLMSQGAGFLLYEITSELFTACFPLLDAIEDEIGVVENDVFGEEVHHRDMLQDIMRLKKNILTFYRIIVPQRAVVAQLEHKNKKFLPKDLEVYFDDIVDQIEKMYNTLENFKALVQNLHDTNESIISHNTNKVMKVLTIFSVILLPMNLIASIYGMNLAKLPYSENPMAFYLFLLGMASLAVTMFIFFRYKKWL